MTVSNFDPEIAYNELPTQPVSFNVNQPVILKKAIKANENLARLRWICELFPNVEIFMRSFLVREAVESNAIDEIKSTVLNVLIAESTKRLEQYVVWNERDALNYRRALIEGFEYVKKYNKIDDELIIRIQEIVEPNNVGVRDETWKKVKWPAGNFVYTPPTGKNLVFRLLHNLKTFINTEHDVDPLIKLAMIHYQFEAIHPFDEGNGKVGRILMMLYLLKVDKLDYPMLFICDYMHKNRQEYFELLLHTTKTLDFTDMIIFVLDAIEKQTSETLKKLQKIKQLMYKTEQELEWTLTIDHHRLTKILFTHPFLTIGSLAEILGITRQTVSTYVKTLEEHKIVVTKKEWKHTLFYIEEFVDLLL